MAAAVCIAVGSGTVASAADMNDLCGSTVTSSLKLKHDLHCSGDGLHVAGEGPVRIDLDGHTISGGGIHVESRGVVAIVDGAVRGGGIGGPRGDIRIDRVTISEAASPLFVGVEGTLSVARSVVNGPALIGPQPGSSGPQLGTLDIHDSRIRDVAINFGVGGGGHRFTNNIFTGGSSIRAVQVNALTISGNTFTDADSALDLHISFGNVVTGNRFIGNAIGLSLNEASGTAVTDNFFVDNGVGAVIRGPVGHPYTIAGNTFRRNGASGLYVHAVGMAASVSDNKFAGNGFDPGTWTDSAGRPLTAGAVLTPAIPSATTYVTDNVATLNAGLGIRAENVTDGGGNRARLNGDRTQCTGVAC